MATTTKSKLEETKTPGVYRRGKKYVYAYRVGCEPDGCVQCP